MKLSIHLITWNGAKYVPYLFDSLRKQTFRNWELFILDNGSTDDTIKAIKKELVGGWCEYKIIQLDKNLGFAGGHNRLMYFSNCHSERSEESLKYSKRDPSTPLRSVQDDRDDYLLLLNQDMYLMPDCIEKLVKFMDENPDAAAISPRLMRWNFANTPPLIPPLLKGGRGDVFTNQIDSLGLKVLRNRRVAEIDAGQKWDINVIPAKAGIQKSSAMDSRLRGNDSVEVFGVSGALPMFRKSAIDKIGLFDESFGSYKEDVDLAFRLRSAGFKSYVVLDAVAYHDRSASGLSDLSDTFALENKKKQSELIKYNSYKNHLMTLIKNEYWQNYLLDLPWIKWYELKKFLYFLIFDRKVLKGLGEIIKRLKDLKIKRLEIKNKRKINWREMRKWFI